MSYQKRIQYHAIFHYEDHSDHIHYDTIASYHKGKKTTLSFHIPEMDIVLSYQDNQIDLKNNQSFLKLDLNQETYNHYRTPYGDILLKIKTLLFEANDQHIKLKYELYDQSQLLNTVYILITLKDC